MKKIITAVFLIASFVGVSQAPKKINYQGVARNSSGTALANTILTLTVDISGVYSETHLVTSNAVGIFTLHIGAGTVLTGTFGAINWGGSANFINVTIDPGTGPVAMPSSQLVSVPYALYADKVSGSAALPTGTVTGQTLYWDATLATPAWKVDNNLTNDGSHVGVGIMPIGLKNKLHVVTGNPADSAAILGYHFNAAKNEAGVRGVAIGSAPTPSFEPISGGNFVGFNYGGGAGAGVTGQGFSSTGDAIGLVGIGTSSSTVSNVGRSVGVYGTALGGLYKNNYAAIFDQGKVLINDSLFFPSTGNPGDILMKINSNAASWTNPGAIGPWTKSGTSIYQNVLTDKVGIGTNSPGANLTVFSPSGYNGNDVAVISQGTGDAFQISRPLGGGGNGIGILFPPSSTGTAIAINNAGSGPSIYINGNASSGIIATTTGTAPTIFAQNTTGNGPSVKGTKTFTGNAGVFDITIPTSSSDALIGSTVGSGAAVHAMSGTIPASALSLWVENGHIKATGPSVTTGSLNVSGGFVTPGFAPILIGCNDVKGTFSFTTTASTMTNGAFIELQINFAKAYSVVPTIVVSSMVDMMGLNHMVTNVTASSFFVRVYKSNATSISFPIALPANYLFKFNYIVIE